jgi:hypothetical protein
VLLLLLLGFFCAAGRRLLLLSLAAGAASACPCGSPWPPVLAVPLLLLLLLDLLGLPQIVAEAPDAAPAGRMPP